MIKIKNNKQKRKNKWINNNVLMKHIVIIKIKNIKKRYKIKIFNFSLKAHILLEYNINSY
jgi:hypothetical protein